MKNLSGYKISQNYTCLTVWYFGKKTKSLLGTVRLKPNPKTSRKERADVIFDHLKREGFIVPAYRATNK